MKRNIKTRRTPEEDRLLQIIAKNLKKLRIENNLTQEKAADALKMHLVSYQKYESQRPYHMKVFTLYKIAQYFDVTVDSLLK
ncbi:MAG: hypothetical protein A2096_12285 [Spirochaetes bacterium GWF1_41_5]|nr:MAG: hypothetical protein A2096_12285 [Spirochaetes bacterium GWF1_41_5]